MRCAPSAFLTAVVAWAEATLAVCAEGDTIGVTRSREVAAAERLRPLAYLGDLLVARVLEHDLGVGGLRALARALERAADAVEEVRS